MMDKISYALGMSIAHNLTNTGVKNLDVDDFMAAMSAVLKGDKTELNPDEADELLGKYFDDIQRETQERLKKAAEAIKVASEKYLKENKTKDGVQVTPSGLQYKVLEEGDGAQPTSHDRVECHYEGRFITGEVFDSSYQRGEPAKFGLQQVIAGWTEGLQLMKVGSKYEFTIPASLGYGENGIPGHIPGNAVLIFTVELLGIEK